MFAKDDAIRISKDGSVLKMEILETIPVTDYLEFTDNHELGDLPFKVVFIDGYNFLSSSLIPQTVYFYQNDNITYYVTNAKDTLRVTEIVKTDEINEIILDMNKVDNTFRVTKSLHDLSLSTKYCISYPLGVDYVPELSIDKVEAYSLVKGLIKRVGKIEELDMVANSYDLCKYTNIVQEHLFHPVTSDEVISISKMFVKDDYNVRNETDQFFDIILNETGEVIGELTYTLYENNFYSQDDTIRYEGNVSYKIKKRYQGNHYATRALKLLVDLIKENTCNVDKDLYVSTTVDNYASQKVALYNGAELCYEGVIPDDNKLRLVDGVSEVKIYKIKI